MHTNTHTTPYYSPTHTHTHTPIHTNTHTHSYQWTVLPAVWAMLSLPQTPRQLTLLA